jgi:putative transposase
VVGALARIWPDLPPGPGGEPRPRVVGIAASQVATEVLKIARQPYYRWLAARVADAEWTAAQRTNALVDADRDDPEFGYRLLADEARDAGQVMAERTAWRICSDNGGWSSFSRRKRGKKTRVGAPAHDDLVRREVTAPGQNQVWRRTSRNIRRPRASSTSARSKTCGPGGSSATPSPSAWNRRSPSSIAVAALDSAVARRAATGQSVAGCVLHTDRGSQFRARKLQQALARHRMIGSMGQVGSAGDNAAMESFFSLLQNNVLNRQHWATRDELRVAIVTWIERTYHRRRQVALGRSTPSSTNSS